MKNKVTLLLISLLIAGMTKSAEARRENPFRAQLPIPIIDTPTPKSDQTQKTTPTPTPTIKPRLKPKRVLLPAPALPQVIAPTIIKPPSLLIKGIIWNSNRPQAIINDIIVGIGDEISGAEITHIEKNQIIYKYLGQTFTLNQ